MHWLASWAISLGLILLKWGSDQPDGIVAHVVVQNCFQSSHSKCLLWS